MAQPKGILFPFRFKYAGGVNKGDGIDKIKANLTALAYTSVNERPIRKEVGTVGYRQVFRPADDITHNLIRDLYRQAIVRFEPRIQVLTIKVSSDQDSDGMHVFIDVNFLFKTTGETSSLTVTV